MYLVQRSIAGPLIVVRSPPLTDSLYRTLCLAWHLNLAFLQFVHDFGGGGSPHCSTSPFCKWSDNLTMQGGPMCKDPDDLAVQNGVDEHLKLVEEKTGLSKHDSIGLCKIRDRHAVAGGVTLWPGVSPPCQRWPHCFATIAPRGAPVGLDDDSSSACTEKEYAAKAAAGWGPLNCEHLGNHSVTGKPLFPQKTLYTKGMANQVYDNRVGCLDKGPFAGWTAPTANLENASDMNTQNCVARAVDFTMSNMNQKFLTPPDLATMISTSEFFRCASNYLAGSREPSARIGIPPIDSALWQAS